MGQQRRGRTVVTAGYQDTAGVTFFSLHVDEEEKISFGSTGEGFGDDDEEDDEDREDWERTGFKHPDHAADWWRTFSNPDRVIDALASEAGVYLPLLYAQPVGGTIELDTRPTDFFHHIERAALVVYGRKGATTARANPASAALAQALQASDPAGTREAPRRRCRPLPAARQQARGRRVGGPLDALEQGQGGRDGVPQCGPHDRGRPRRCGHPRGRRTADARVRDDALADRRGRCDHRAVACRRRVAEPCLAPPARRRSDPAAHRGDARPARAGPLPARLRRRPRPHQCPRQDRPRASA